MKLYYNPVSPNCRRVVALLHHIDFKIELQMVDVMAGQCESPEFLKMNPNGMVPVLEDGSFHLFESNAIMQYLAEKKGNTAVWPTDSRARADVSRWQCWQLAHLNPPVSALMWENMFKPMMGAGAPDQEAIKESMEGFRTFATVLNNHLAGKQYLCGSQATLADFSIASNLMYAEAIKLPLNDFPNIKQWYGRMESLDAWKKSTPPKM